MDPDLLHKWRRPLDAKDFHGFTQHPPHSDSQQLLVRPLWHGRAGALHTLAGAQVGADAVLLQQDWVRRTRNAAHRC